MTSPRTRWVLPALLLTVALTATGTAGAADGQAAPARSPLTGAADETADGVSAAPATTVQSAAFAAEDFCSRLPAGARTAAPDAVTACVSVDSGTGTATRTKTAAPTPATADLAADDPAGDGIGTEFEPDADDPEPPAPSCALTNQETGPGAALAACA